MIFLLAILQLCCGFRMMRPLIKMTNSQTPPQLWSALSSVLKNNARNWFISRAEVMGIDWNYMKKQRMDKLERLRELKNDSVDHTIEYPEYYTQPFHGYDKGNLNWMAAVEGEPATLSIALNYWKESNPLITQDWLRYNISKNIKEYLKNTSILNTPKNILDIGCSVGVSSEFLYKSFRSANVTGIDLSPYFIAMAKLRSEEFDFPINYYHRMAENSHFENNTFDLTACNFIMHELPEHATKDILKEMYRITSHGGTIAIVDLTPVKIKNEFFVSAFRRWSFEVTEPHIYGYYNRDIIKLLKDAGFVNIVQKSNDPINSVWLASKY